MIISIATLLLLVFDLNCNDHTIKIRTSIPINTYHSLKPCESVKSDSVDVSDNQITCVEVEMKLEALDLQLYQSIQVRELNHCTIELLDAIMENLNSYCTEWQIFGTH